MRTMTNFFRNTIAITIMILAVSAINTAAATFTVTNINNTGAGSLRQAILDSNAAAGSDTIVFDSSFSTARTITLASSILIFPAAGDTLTINGPGMNLLTVSGGGTTGIFTRAGNGDHGFTLSGLKLTQSSDTVIGNPNTGARSSLTVTNVAFVSNSGGFAGAINNAAALTVTNCVFTNNVMIGGGATGNGGGAIYNSTAAETVTIMNSTFTGNRQTIAASANGGGAIRNRFGTMTITNSTFTNNSPAGNGGGGAISTDQVMTISGSTFTGNSTTALSANGGAIIGFGQLTINNSVISENSTAANGGGIYYQANAAPAGSVLSITDSTVSNNTANSDSDTNGGGGGIHLSTSSATISGSTINGNRANAGATGTNGNGGGIEVRSNAVLPTTLTNVTVSGNTAGRTGGGIYTAGVTNIVSSTVVGNTAAVNGGGVIRANSIDPVNLRNSIFANNTASGSTSQDIFGTVNSNGYNLIENSTGATITGTTTGNITGVDPRIDPILRTNGGTTKTHALHLTSPARNTADPANNPSTDQRGLARTTPDIGAYERQTNDIVVPAAFDFDDDVRADLSVFRPSDNSAIADFYVRRSGDNSLQSVSWGSIGDVPTPGDYDGDGKTDVAIWRENSGNPNLSYFFILRSTDGTVQVEQFGRVGDNPSFVGDWDGDARADVAVYRPSNSTFYYRPSATPATSFVGIQWGTGGDIPMRGDFDGDIKLDAAIFRPSDATWYIRQSSDSQLRVDNWGLSTDKFVPSDYDGDGLTDLAVFRNGTWYIKQSSNNQARYQAFGLTTDILVPADYDNDGKTDLAVFRNGNWYLQQSTSGFSAINFGLSSDMPVPNTFIP